MKFILCVAHIYRLKMLGIQILIPNYFFFCINHCYSLIRILLFGHNYLPLNQDLEDLRTARSPNLVFASPLDVTCQNYKICHTPAKEILFRVNADPLKLFRVNAAPLKHHIFINIGTQLIVRFIPTPLQVKIRPLK